MASAVLLAAVLLLASPAAMHAATAPAPAPAKGASSSSKPSGACGTEKFPAGKSYANCTVLSPLGAKLYWTYHAAAATLSVAFVAKPAGPGGAGWVAWAVNPTGDGMKGAQCLLAMKGPKGTFGVRTYNITGYAPLPATSTSIAFKATGLGADESGAGGSVRLYGKLQLAPGTEVVNHIWQVGSAIAADGSPAKHAFAKENLDAKGKLALVGGVTVAPAPAPEDSAASSTANKAGGGSGSPSPSGGKSAAAATAATYVSAPVLAVLALVGFLATV